MPRATQDTAINNKTLPVRDYHPLWSNFPARSSSVLHRISRSYNPNIAETTLVWASPISLAATLGITLVFSSSGYLDVSVHRVCPPCGVIPLHGTGLPHSEIRGSIRMCRSPRLIAAYRVLRRLWEPRHSPCALDLLVVLFCSLMSLIQCQAMPQRARPSLFSYSLVPNMSMNRQGKRYRRDGQNRQLAPGIARCPWWSISESNR